MADGIERWWQREKQREDHRRDKCETKRVFSSEAEARAHAAADRAQFGDRFSAYRCDRCGDWHLTRSDT